MEVGVSGPPHGQPVEVTAHKLEVASVTIQLLQTGDYFALEAMKLCKHVRMDFVEVNLVLLQPRQRQTRLRVLYK